MLMKMKFQSWMLVNRNTVCDIFGENDVDESDFIGF